jgi:anti-sigma-K factor RskA
MTEDQNPSSETEPGDGQLLTSAQPRAAQPAPASAPASPAPHGTATAPTAAPTAPAAASVDTAPSRTKRSPWRQRLIAAGVAVALVVGAVGLTAAVEEQRSRDARSLISAQRDRLNAIQAVLTAPDVVTRSITTTDGAKVTAVFSAEKVAAVVTYQNLPDIPAKQTYEIFRVRDDKTKPLRILAPAARSGTAMLLGLGEGDALAFTVEPEGGSGQPTGDVVIGLRLS